MEHLGWAIQVFQNDTLSIRYLPFYSISILWRHWYVTWFIWAFKGLSPDIINVSHEYWFLVFLFHCCISNLWTSSQGKKYSNIDKTNNICLSKIAFLNLRCWPEDRRLRSRVQYRKRIESAMIFKSIDTFQNCQNIGVSNIWYRISAHPY